MKCTKPANICLFVCALASSPASAVSMTYDEAYDNPAGLLSTVACSDGANGLRTLGYTNFASLPRFPLIGAVAAVTGWNSTHCGTCWRLSYARKGWAHNTTVLAIDVSNGADGGPALVQSAGGGLAVLGDLVQVNVARAAMDELTGGLAEELGMVDVACEQVPVALCGM